MTTTAATTKQQQQQQNGNNKMATATATTTTKQQHINIINNQERKTITLVGFCFLVFVFFFLSWFGVPVFGWPGLPYSSNKMSLGGESAVLFASIKTCESW